MTAWSKMVFLGILTIMFLLLAIVELFTVQDADYPTDKVVYSLLVAALVCCISSICYHHMLVMTA